MTKLEFAQFSVAVMVDGKNLLSAHNKDYEIDQVNEWKFRVRSRFRPQAVTYVGITNVAHWRELPQDDQPKSKSNKS